MSEIHTIEPEYGTGKKNIKSYVIGLVLCIILTLIPFYAVIEQTWSRTAILWTLLIAALLQLWVQIACFLRLNTKTKQGKVNIMTFVFALVVVGILVGGSLWIMFNLNYNMMH